MNAKHLALANAARKALFQRTQLLRSADAARGNFAPQALKQRATDSAVRVLDDTVDSAQAALRHYAVPLGLVAVAGLAFAFRRPLGAAAQQAADLAADAADAIAEQFHAYRQAAAAADQDTEPQK